MFTYALLLVFPAAMFFAAAMDLFTMTIPNRISLALIASFAIAAPLCGLPAMAYASHLGAGLLMLGIGFLMFWRGWVGGGDAKLIASAALWVGLPQLLNYLLLVTLAGGVLAMAIMLFRSVALPPIVAVQPWAARLHDKDGGIPYGIAIAVAAIWIYPSTAWFASLGG